MQNAVLPVARMCRPARPARGSSTVCTQAGDRSQRHRKRIRRGGFLHLHILGERHPNTDADQLPVPGRHGAADSTQPHHGAIALGRRFEPGWGNRNANAATRILQIKDRAVAFARSWYSGRRPESTGLAAAWVQLPLPKWKSSLACTRTARPREVGGANFHCFTASIASTASSLFCSTGTEGRRTAPVSSI